MALWESYPIKKHFRLFPSGHMRKTFAQNHRHEKNNDPRRHN